MQSAAVVSKIPLGGGVDVAVKIQLEGQARNISLSGGAVITTRFVSPGYFQTFGIPLLSGRGFTDADTADSERVVIVDQAFAKKYFDGHALGHRISTDNSDQPEWMEIVGVVATSRDANLERATSGEIYHCYAQETYRRDAYFVARTSENPAVMIPALRLAIWSVDKDAPITEVYTMDQLVGLNAAEPKFQALLLGSFGAFGLILAMVGIYGIISYGVTQRTHEIGIRMALGAHPGNVLRMVIREGMVLAGAGIVLGIAGALALGRVLESVLFQIKPTDPATFVSVAILLAVVSATACYVPARRAMRVEPMEALRYE